MLAELASFLKIQKGRRPPSLSYARGKEYCALMYEYSLLNIITANVRIWTFLSINLMLAIIVIL